MKIETLNDVYIWQPPPLQELVSSQILLQGTKANIFGGAKLFKSLVAQQLAFCLVTGQDWFGFTTQRCSCWYIQAEIPRAPFKGRVMKMATSNLAPGSIQGGIWFSTAMTVKFDTDKGFKELLSGIQQLRPMIVIIDPLYKFLSGMETAAGQKFQDNIDRIIESFGTTFIIIAHSRKSQVTNSGGVMDLGAQELWGWRGWEWWFDSILQVRGDPADDNRSLHFELRHGIYQIPPMNFRLDRTKLWCEIY